MGTQVKYTNLHVPHPHNTNYFFFVPYSCILNTHLVQKLIFSLYPLENINIYRTLLLFTNNIFLNLTFTIHWCINCTRTILITCF